MVAAAGELRLKSGQGRAVLAATVLGSGVAFLDATVVNVALPALAEDLDADVAGLQWVLNGYLLPLAALILLGGSLGDRFGRRKVFLLGVVWFAAASLLCAVAPTLPVLVAARALQGIGGALLTPGSLAILEAVLHPDDRAEAIGAWSALGGVSSVAGPLVGGWLVDAASWRWVFLINLPLAAVVVWLGRRSIPESSNPEAARSLDVPGAVAAAVALGGTTYALVEAGDRGMGTAAVVAGALGVAGLVAFLLIESRSRHPMLPLGIFRNRRFSAANAMTFATYAALGATFLVVVQLQTSLGYSPIEAGLSLLPVTILMLVLSPRAAALSARIGPRWPMTIGPLVIGLGLALLAMVGPGDRYATAVLLPAVVFGLGLALTVAPLTATVMGSVDDRLSGLASGVNNAVARAAALLAVAVLPAVAGLSGVAPGDVAAFTDGYQVALLVAAGLSVAGGALSAAAIR